MEKALIQGFAQNFNAEMKLGEITDTEQELKQELYKQKYSTREWNRWR